MTIKKCPHGKRKTYCKECGGSQICEHDRVKYSCKECCGSQICEHDRRRTNCKECGGGSVCEHSRRRSDCKKCGGSQICEHKRDKNKCKECFGGSICKHKIQKTICKECGGGSLCKHDKIRRTCKECGGGSLCKIPLCETRANAKYEGYCMSCFVNNPENRDKPAMRNYKTKEKDVVDRIREIFPDFTWVADKRVYDGCSLRRPDLLLDLGSHIVIIEVDENKHEGYDCACENKRLMELSQDLDHRPIVFIRFNPDSYINEDGETIKSCWKLNKQGIMGISKNKVKEWEDRINCLKQQIHYWVENKSDKTVEIVELFY